MRNLVHHFSQVAQTHTALIAPVVLLAVGLLLAAAPRRTIFVGLLLVVAVHYQVVRLPDVLRTQVALEDGTATSQAVACRLGAIAQPFRQCPTIQLPDPFARPFTLLP